MPEEAAIMTEHTEHTPTQSGAVPARMEPADFIEAVTCAVARALAAQDEVSGCIAQGGAVGGYLTQADEVNGPVTCLSPAVVTVADEADTTGYRESLYDGAGELYLWKGPPSANPFNQPNAGGGRVVVAAGSELWNQSGIPQALRALDWYL
jgi:hypothetical protein